ncbi:MAG: hypothetical protein WDO24_01940 [Pseudomonadota bacterium]
MKPKEAAQIFDKLEINVLLGVIERMRRTRSLRSWPACSPSGRGR